MAWPDLGADDVRGERGSGRGRLTLGRHGNGAALMGRRAVGCALLLASALLLAVTSGGEARAQSRGGLFPFAPQGAPRASPGNFFSLLFGGLRPHVHETPERPRIVITPRVRGSGSSGASWGAGVAYCVRTCDGRYFPLQGKAGEEGGALAQCNAFCPAATMAIYTSSDSTRGIDAAVSRAGKAYSELPNAFVYRQRLVEGCTCTEGSRIGGLNRIDVMNDPTLRRGDVVMTEEGSRVFTGGRKGPPYREADFVEPARFPDLSRDMRARLSELEMASR